MPLFTFPPPPMNAWNPFFPGGGGGERASVADGGAELGSEGGGNGSTVDFDVLNSFFMTPSIGSRRAEQCDLYTAAVCMYVE